MDQAVQQALKTVHINSFGEKLDGIADRLRRLAEDVDRARSGVGKPGAMVGSYAEIAAEVQHTVLWGMANLNLDNLTIAARRADEATTAISEGTACPGPEEDQ